MPIAAPGSSSCMRRPSSHASRTSMAARTSGCSATPGAVPMQGRLCTAATREQHGMPRRRRTRFTASRDVAISAASGPTGGARMRHGCRVIDSDTHVNPSLDVLLRHADRELRERIDDLEPYRRMVKPVPGSGDAEDVDTYSLLSIKPIRLGRVAGEKAKPAREQGGDRGFLSGRTQMVTREPIAARAAEDNAKGRLHDMDVEGRDIDFI